MTKSEFVAELRRLEQSHGTDAPSPGCLNSTNLSACSYCMFSKDLQNCYKCTHCADCTDCSALSHSTGCESCHASAYLIDCRYVNSSAYLINSIACADCNYCLGCVGLNKKDFHILNEKHSRSEYFAKLKKLKRELGFK